MDKTSKTVKMFGSQQVGKQQVVSGGHGAYIAPDWNADYLHRESEMLLDIFAAKDGKVYKDLSEEEQAKYQVQLRKELRTNTFNQENRSDYFLSRTCASQLKSWQLITPNSL